MKIFISVDIEGVACISNWNETDKAHPDHAFFAEQMSREAAAAANTALSLGADEVTVRDAHGSGRNLNPLLFDPKVRFIRQWNGDPLSMMHGIDNSFDACMMIGYHSGAGWSGNPLSHTFRSSSFHEININGQVATEFMFNSYSASLYDVPVIFVSGDEMLTESATELVPGIKTVSTFSADGSAINSMHPLKAVEMIEEQVAEAMKTPFPDPIRLPEHIECKITFINHQKCDKASYYPGVERISSTTLQFPHDDWYEVLRFLMFAKYACAE